MRNALSLACLVLSCAAGTVGAAAPRTEGDTPSARIVQTNRHEAADTAMAERLVALELRMRTMLRLRGLPVPPTYGINQISDQPDPISHTDPNSQTGETIGRTGRWKLTNRTTEPSDSGEAPSGGRSAERPPRRSGGGGNGSGSGSSNGGQDGG
jgi:hypothetical protein